MVSEKSMPITKKRNEGVDLLRIIAMFMVLFLHILGNGGILFEAEVLSSHGIVAWFFEMATFCAINCYGVISGYVGIDTKYKYSSLAYLWLQVAFYSVFITLFFHIRYPETFTSSYLTEFFFPVCNQKYWYVTAYVGMFLFMPVLSNAVKGLKKAQLRAVLIMLFVALSLLPACFETDIFMTGWGYGMLWLSFLYLCGAYIKLYGFLKNSPKLALLLYSVCVIVSWLVKLWEEAVSTEGKYANLATGFIAQYTSPTIFLSGVALFVIFANIRVPERLHKIIKFVSPCAFGVYIIHAHPIMWDRLITYKYAHYINYNPIFMMAMVFLTALCMFVILAFIDFVRLQIFNLLRIKPLLQKAENKLLGDLWD